MSDTITIVGIIGTDPERKSPNGLPITTFRVASPQRRFDRATGAWTDSGTNWYTVSAYRRLAEHAFASLRKKDRVILTGRLRIRSWDTGESKGTAMEIDLEAIGHDLFWGTSVFTRDAPAAVASPSEPGADAWAPAEAADPAWGSPAQQSTGADALTSPAPAPTDVPPAQLALAGAEVPF
ncbi:single-stranded DNA-binding protein [Microbacterium terregens]|uniref:Single-stranded DNA-binding protein n=1 Tax=Microbacterium terregens TaxID=69363 RepID=A0ABV5T3X9_9MICO